MSELVYTPNIDGIFKYHVFIAFSYQDEAIAMALTNHLRAHGLKVCICKEQFLIGQIVDNISYSISQARRTLMLMSSSYVKSDWFEYESSLVIHEQKKRRKHILIPVIMDLKPEEIPGRIEVSKVLYINYDSSRSDTYSQITAACKAPDLEMCISLPLQNIAEGLAWSYFGYLRIIIPSFKERFMKTEYWKHSPSERRMTDRFFVLLPDSGYCHPRISDCDQACAYVGTLESVYKDKAGSKGRPFTNQLLSFTRPGTDQTYYFSGEYATPLYTMFEVMKIGQSSFNREELLHQVKLFRQKLDEIISKLFSMEEASSVCLLQYMDHEEGRCDLANLLAQKIDMYNQEEIRDLHMRLS